VATMPSLSELRIPEQKKEKSWFDTRPKKITEWVEALPLGDTEETTKQLFSVLRHTNRIQISAPVRLKMLDCLYPTFNFCITSLKKNFTGQSFPLNARALKFVDRTMAMYSELTDAYKITCVDFIQRDHFYEKKSFARALYMALDTLGKLQLSHYQIYTPEPALLWSDIHQLLLIAEHNDIHHLALKDLAETPAIKTSIEEQYKQILLLSLCNPYHLGKNEIERVYQLLKKWSSYTRLINPDNETKGEAHFVACLNNDKPPVELNLFQAIESSICRFIDTSELTQHLRNLLTQKQEAFSLKESSTLKNEIRQFTLYRQLINAWDTREKRSFSRSPSQGGIDISIGLNSTHYIIEECNKPLLPELEEDAEEHIEQVNHGYIDDTRNPLEINHTTFSIEPISGKPDSGSYWNKNKQNHIDVAQLSGKYTDQAIPKPAYKYHQWKTLNAGAGGYCLLWDHDKSSNAQIGEIVGIREAGNGNGSSWRIGVVRWMQYIRNHGVKLGIQILAPNASTIQSRLMKGAVSKKQEYSCLSLPEMKIIQQPASLLTPSMHYKVGDALILNDHGKMMNVQLTRLLENTGNYSRFQYAPLNTREAHDFEKDIEQQTNGWDFSED